MMNSMIAKTLVVVVMSVVLSGCSISETIQIIPGLNTVFDTPANTFLLDDDSTQEVDDRLIDTVEVLYTDFGFEPATLEIQPYTRVVFLNQTAAKMWIKSDQPIYSFKPTFDQEDGARAGEWYSIVFLKEGTWNYINFLNVDQSGTIVVTE